jgi:hypothetical protein
MELLNKELSIEVDEGAIKNESPILLSFPSGAPDDGKESDFISLQLWQKKKVGSRTKRILSLEQSGIEYRGCDFGANGSSFDSCNYAVGVYDASTKTLQLFPALHPFAMNQVPLADSKATEADSSNVPSYLRRKALTEAFGSRKKQRAVKAAESNIISIENISGANVIEDRIADSIIQSNSGAVAQGAVDAAEKALAEQRGQVLPPFDLAATECSEAYPITGIIPEELHSALVEVYDSQLAAATCNMDTKAEWLAHYFPHLSGDSIASLFPENIAAVQTKHKKSTKQRVARIMYLDMMLNFYKKMASSRAVAKDDLITTGIFPNDILRYMSFMFAVLQKRGGKDAIAMPSAHSQKILMHIIVLFLHVGEFKVNLSSLAKVFSLFD